MRFALLVLIAVCLICCDDNRVFEDNRDFINRSWVVTDTVMFEFEVPGSEAYNLHCDIRNSLDYPWQRLFVTYTLEDSTHKVLSKKLVGKYLFDAKTGEPFGNSSLGDIYDHRFPLIENQVLAPGKYFVSLRQEMRTDTLPGVLAAGVRVEKVVK